MHGFHYGQEPDMLERHDTRMAETRRQLAAATRRERFWFTLLVLGLVGAVLAGAGTGAVITKRMRR